MFNCLILFDLHCRSLHFVSTHNVSSAIFEKSLILTSTVRCTAALCFSRYKTIQELNKKIAAKDKSMQEMRKRMEQAQLIAIPGTISAERRNSVSNNESKSISWETPSRLATVNE